jgi:exopolyphosphatase/guanosine-5'-triphosphate,3'-diphosphate pyrophosphatase
MLLLIAEYDSKSQSVKTILDIQRLPRLGKGVDSARNILPDSIKKAVSVLNEYRAISEEHNSEKIFATATSFIRDANNKKEFLIAIKDKTGIDIEILAGEDEAKWAFIGGVYDKLQITGSELQISIIDIGGGSTEITTGVIKDTHDYLKNLDNIPIKGKSIDVGSVRLNEKYLSHHPPSFENIVHAEDFVKQNLEQIDFDLKNSSLIGVAGTVTTLAAIKLHLNEFIASKVDETILTLDEIESIFTRVAAMPLEEIYALGSFMEGRADIIIPGILILKTFMEKFGFDKITVSTKGLRYGIFIREDFKNQSE